MIHEYDLTAHTFQNEILATCDKLPNIDDAPFLLCETLARCLVERHITQTRDLKQDDQCDHSYRVLCELLDFLKSKNYYDVP